MAVSLVRRRAACEAGGTPNPENSSMRVCEQRLGQNAQYEAPMPRNTPHHALDRKTIEGVDQVRHAPCNPIFRRWVSDLTPGRRPRAVMLAVVRPHSDNRATAPYAAELPGLDRPVTDRRRKT